MTPTGEHEGFAPPSPSSNRRRRSRSNSAFAAAAMVPSIVAGSIGGWSPVERPGEGGSIKLPPSRGINDADAQEAAGGHLGPHHHEPTSRDNLQSQYPEPTHDSSSLAPPRP